MEKFTNIGTETTIGRYPLRIKISWDPSKPLKKEKLVHPFPKSLYPNILAGLRGSGRDGHERISKKTEVFKH